MDSWYYDETEVARRVAAGDHRDIIGGMWEEIGSLQFRWLVEHGMECHHRLLDLGCGSGRLAVKAVPFLVRHHYFGLDLSPALLAAARCELEAIGQSSKLRDDALLATANFAPSPTMPLFDYVMALSLFTHLQLAKLGQAFAALRPRLAPGGRFYATFFVAPAETAELFHERGGVTTYCDRDPYHYAPDVIAGQARICGWTANFIGEWNHPRGQQMFEFLP